MKKYKLSILQCIKQWKTCVNVLTRFDWILIPCCTIYLSVGCYRLDVVVQWEHTHKYMIDGMCEYDIKFNFVISILLNSFG